MFRFSAGIKLNDGDIVTVTLKEAGEYLNVQEVLSQSYSNDIGDYNDEIQFANFRAISAGKLKENFLYRGVTPVDSQKNRAKIVNDLLEKNDIHFILDPADTEEEYLGYRSAEDFASFYADELYDSGNIALPGMNASYDTNRNAHASDYAKAQGIYVSSTLTHAGEDTSYYRLRSAGDYSSDSTGVYEDGYIGYGWDTGSFNYGIRPVMYINLTTDISDSAPDIYNFGEETYSFRNYTDKDSSGGHCFGMSMTSAGYLLTRRTFSEIRRDFYIDK